MRYGAVLLATGLALAFASAASAQAERTSASVRLEGGQALTRTLATAIEGAFAASSEFTIVEPFVEAKMVVWFTEPVRTTAGDDRIVGRFAVGNDQRAFADGSFICPVAQPNVCADTVLERARRYRRMAERVAR